MAVHSFLEEYDFMGKTVVSFVILGNRGRASAIQDITADLPDAKEFEPIGVYRPEVDGSKPVVDVCLNELGFESRKTDSE